MNECLKHYVNTHSPTYLPTFLLVFGITFCCTGMCVDYCIFVISFLLYVGCLRLFMNSVTRLDDFGKFLAPKNKSIPNVCLLQGQFLKMSLFKEYCCVSFWIKFGLLFIPTFGHIVHEPSLLSFLPSFLPSSTLLSHYSSTQRRFPRGNCGHEVCFRFLNLDIIFFLSQPPLSL